MLPSLLAASSPVPVGEPSLSVGRAGFVWQVGGVWGAVQGVGLGRALAAAAAAAAAAAEAWRAGAAARGVCAVPREPFDSSPSNRLHRAPSICLALFVIGPSRLVLLEP